MIPYATPRGDAYNAALGRVLPGAVHSNFRGRGEPAPVRIERALGSRVFDIDGNQYLDLSAAYGALCLGHGHAEFADALRDQIGRALQIVNGDLELDATAAIRRWFPRAEMVRFGLSGTEAVSNAIRLARAFTGRQRVLRFGHHYHGSSDLLLGGSPPAKPGAPEAAQGDPFETAGASEGIRARECVMSVWNDAAHVLATVDAFAESIACVLMEPVGINGGGVAAEPGFAAALASACRRHRVLLIVDETITGVRMGPGGAQAALGLEPDLFVLGKAVSNGIPASVLAGRADIMLQLAERKVVHGGTFNGYPLALRAIVSTLDLLSRDDFRLVRQAERMTADLAALVLRAAADAGVAFHVNRFGTAAILHPCSEGDGLPAYAALPAGLAGGLLAKTLLGFGVMLCPVTRCYVTCAVNEDDLDWLATRLRATFAAVGPKIARLAAVRAR